MKKDVVLHDLRENRHFVGKEDEIRTLQVYECKICGAHTNRAISIHGPYYQRYARSVCPNAAEDWHHALRRKLALRNPNHPAGYLRELDEEIASMRAAAAAHVKNDIQGKPDFSQIKAVSIVRIDRYHDSVSGEMRELVHC